MRVLVACEYSGRVRNALLEIGHDVLSCDLLESEDNSIHHIQGNVEPLLSEPWDLVIAHPPCTYLANSGVRWLYSKDPEDMIENLRVEERWDNLHKSAEFFLACLNANAPKVAVENPVMHKYAREAIGGLRPDFTVRPWQFGDPAKKRTCFWTRGLPPLTPTSEMSADEAIAECHLASPGPDRWKDRSRTYPGIAAAIASQWGRASRKTKGN